MERKIRLGELLIRAGLITELQLKAALSEQRKWGGRLGRILVDMNFISEDILIKGLARLLQVPRADLSRMSVPDEILQRFDPNDCQNRGYLPLQYHAAEKKLTLAMVDVNDLALLDELRFKYGFNFEPAISGEHALLNRARQAFYGAAMSPAAGDPGGGIQLVDNLGGNVAEQRPAPAAETVQARRIPTGVERPAVAPAATPVAPAATPAAPAGPAASFTAQLTDIESNQRRQARAIKTVVELLIEKGVIKSVTNPLRGWFFCLAFVSIGLESNFKELAKQMEGGKPMILYVVGQSFNLILTLFIAWLAFIVLVPNAI